MRSMTAALIFLFTGAAAVSVKPTDVDALTTSAPRSTTLLSLLAERRESIARQMTELQEYSADNKATITTSRDEQLARLVKQAQECKECEEAEIKLQEAYNESLAAHEYVEKVDADVLKQTKAEGAYNVSVGEKEKAEAARDAYEAGPFRDAQKKAMGEIGGVGCGDGSTIGQFKPLIMADIKFDVGPILVALNAKAEQLRALQKTVEEKIGDTRKMLAAWNVTKKESIAGALCGASHCTPADIVKAKTASGLKDAALVGATAKKDAECAAIDQEKWGNVGA